MAEPTAEDVARFWIEEVGQERWYAKDDTLDELIRMRFMKAWEAALAGEMYEWCEVPERTLGFLILTDQLPRNMFRGDPRSFATDPLARTAAKRAIHRRWDMQVTEPERQFFYMPLMHSEVLDDQDRCIRLMSERMPKTGGDNIPHAKVHREIIRKFGRFPYRNEALGRMTLPAEQAFLDGNGYADLLKQVTGAGKAA